MVYFSHVSTFFSCSNLINSRQIKAKNKTLQKLMKLFRCWAEKKLCPCKINKEISWKLLENVDSFIICWNVEKKRNLSSKFEFQKLRQVSADFELFWMLTVLSDLRWDNFKSFVKFWLNFWKFLFKLLKKNKRIEKENVVTCVWVIKKEVLNLIFEKF